MHKILRSFSARLFILATALTLGFSAIPAPVSAAIVSGTLVKSPSFSAVYYVGSDGKRYVFSNSKVYFTWYQNFTTVQTITDTELASLRIGGNVTYRPGVKMIKIQSDPKVYAVARGGVLRHISSEAVAAAYYGPSWNQFIDDVDVTDFVNYRMGVTITSVGDFSPTIETNQATSINVDRGLLAVDPAPNTPQTPTPTPNPAGQLIFRLNTQTPATASVARGATGVRVLTFDVRHDGTSATTIESISVRRFGTGPATDISRVALYNVDTRVSSSFVWNSSDRVTISGLNLAISPGQTHVLTLVADFSTNATQTQTHIFEISSMIAGGQQVSGSPIQGNIFTISANLANTLTVTAVSAASGLVRGSADQTFGIFRLTAGDSESVRINRILLQVATNNTSLSNVKLYNGNTLLSTVTTLDSAGRANFALSNPIVDILANNSIDLTVKATIATGASASVYKVYLGQDSDIFGTGVLTSNSVRVDRNQFDNSSDNGSDAVWANVSGPAPAPTIALAVASTSNAARSGAYGGATYVVLNFTIANSGTNTATINSLSVRRVGASGANADFTGMYVMCGGSNAFTMSAFASGTDLSTSTPVNALSILSNTSATCAFYARVAQGATVGNQSAFEVSSVQSGSTLATGVPARGGVFTVLAPAPTANFTVVQGLPIASANVYRGQTVVPVLNFSIYNADVSPLTLDTIIANRMTGADVDVSGMYLYDGATRISPSTTLSGGYANFGGLTLTIPSRWSKTLTLYMDVSNSAVVGDALRFQVTYVASGTSQPTSGLPVQGNTFTVIAGQATAPTITASVANVQIGALRGGSQQTIAVFNLAAGNTENLNLNRLALTFSGINALTQLSQFSLYNGNTWIMSVRDADSSSWITFPLSDFNASIPLLSGTTTTMSLKVDVNANVSLGSVVATYVSQDADLVALGATTGARATVTRSAFDNSSGSGTTSSRATIQ